LRVSPINLARLGSFGSLLACSSLASIGTVPGWVLPSCRNSKACSYPLATSGTRANSTFKFARSACETSRCPICQIFARALTAKPTSVGSNGLFPLRPNGPSVSVRTRSRGIMATICLPRSDRSIAGPTENQHPSDTASDSSRALPENQCSTAVSAQWCCFIACRTSPAARRLCMVRILPP
jgi:hypothetical protein